MKQLQNISTIFLLFLIITLVFSTIAYANSAEPPCLTVIVSFPPEDLTLSIRFADGNETEAILLKKEQKAWETYYRFFYGMANTSGASLNEDAKLIVESGEKSFECTLPVSTFNRYNNLLTLDFNSQKVVLGQFPFRTPLLIAMRVTLTLLIEGLIFFIFGYRKKSSWITFLCVNLFTQGALNVLLSGPNLTAYWIFGLAFYEIIIFIVEAILFAAILKEYKKGRAVTYALVANIISLLLGCILISSLPV